jgi:hypothetical protein
MIDYTLFTLFFLSLPLLFICWCLKEAILHFFHIQSTNNAPMSWLLQVKFWLVLALSISSALCSIVILIHFYRQRRNLSPHHHLTLILIVTSFIQVTTLLPLAMAYYQRGEVIPATSVFCTWWDWWEYGSNGVLRFTVAWGSVDRHLLVFYNSLMPTRRSRFVLHILPMLITCSYPAIFYFAVMILNTCEKHWNYETVISILQYF